MGNSILFRLLAYQPKLLNAQSSLFKSFKSYNFLDYQGGGVHFFFDLLIINPYIIIFATIRTIARYVCKSSVRFFGYTIGNR